MPLIHYLCECKHSMSKFYRKPEESPKNLECERCKLLAKKTMSAPNSTSVVVIDNGIQARAITVNPEIIEINEERSKKDYREE